MLKHENEEMFYKLCLDNMAEFTPIIYTPTVGEACQKWSHIYRRPEGMVCNSFDLTRIYAVANSHHSTSLSRTRVKSCPY
jgi:malate dehydrogenase (oxaloacetate-decarboxylating)(NADP+)